MAYNQVMSDEPLSAIEEPPVKAKKKTPFWKELFFGHIFILLSAAIVLLVRLAAELGLLAYKPSTLHNSATIPSLEEFIRTILYLGAPYTYVLVEKIHHSLYITISIFVWATQISIYFYSLKYAFNDHKLFSSIWVRRYLAACIGGFVGYLVVFGIFDHFFIYHKYNRVPF